MTFTSPEAAIQGPAVEVGQQRGSWLGLKLGMGLVESISGHEVDKDNAKHRRRHKLARE
jgi:hypothetical protein